MNNTSTGSGPSIPLVTVHHNHQQNHTIVLIVPTPVPPPLNLPCLDLLEGIGRVMSAFQSRVLMVKKNEVNIIVEIEGPGEDYFNIGVPLYEATIKGDWKAAQPILVAKPDLVRFAITENYETMLHVAASTESTRAVQKFVIELVYFMEQKDLELQNKNSDTPLSLAAAVGNVKIAMMMMEKNRTLTEIPGRDGRMPLYVAALFAKADMVRYLYDTSNQMSGYCWFDDNRGLVLQKCVEAEIFDVALRIVNDCPKLTVKKELLSNILLALAQKAHAFQEGKRHVIFRIINSSTQVPC